MSHDKLEISPIDRSFLPVAELETAVAAIEDHLLKLWDPRMRRAIITQLAEGRVQLDPLVRQAVERLQGR
jgi:hypothetical protein